jgi:hypothetical protein
VKIENAVNSNRGAVPAANEDSEMVDGSMVASDDEGGEDGEEGDEGDDDEGSVSTQDSPLKPPRPISPTVSELPHMREIPNIGSPDTEMSGTDDLPGPPLPKLETAQGKSGSPLKNVAMTTSTLTSPIKSQASSSENLPTQQPIPETSNILNAADPVKLDEAMQREVAEIAPTTLPPPRPEPTMAEAIASTKVLQEEEEEEEMLLDIVENTGNANIGGPQEAVVAAAEIAAQPILETQEPAVAVPETQHAEAAVPAPEEVGVEAAAQQALENKPDQGEEDEEAFTDLLGGLEKQLDEPQFQAAPIVETHTDPPKP